MMSRQLWVRRSIENRIQKKLEFREEINLDELSQNLDLGIDSDKAIRHVTLNILRRMVREVANSLGIVTFFDGHGKAILVETTEDARRVIKQITKQVAGRGESLMRVQKLESDMPRSSSHRGHKTYYPPEQLTLSDFTEDDAALADQVSYPKLAPVIALRARDSEQAQDIMIQQLVEDWDRTNDWELASSHFFKTQYGFDVKLPAALFSEGVVSPVELYHIWRRLAPALRAIRQKPDHHRKASSGETDPSS